MRRRRTPTAGGVEAVAEGKGGRRCSPAASRVRMKRAAAPPRRPSRTNQPKKKGKKIKERKDSQRSIIGGGPFGSSP